MRGWTADAIARAIGRSVFPWRDYVLVPNVSWGMLPHEADLIAVSESLWLKEVEIKISKADFLADRKKWKHAMAARMGQHHLVSEFYYAMPGSIWQKCKPEDLPEGAGLILVSPEYRAGDLRAWVEKKAEHNPSSRKLNPKEHYQAMRLGYMRYWCRQDAVEALLAGLMREAESMQLQK